MDCARLGGSRVLLSTVRYANGSYFECIAVNDGSKTFKRDGEIQGTKVEVIMTWTSKDKSIELQVRFAGEAAKDKANP
jgi:hypothetical protein